MAVEKELPPAVLEGFGGLRTGINSAVVAFRASEETSKTAI